MDRSSLKEVSARISAMVGYHSASVPACPLIGSAHITHLAWLLTTYKLVRRVSGNDVIFDLMAKDVQKKCFVCGWPAV